MGAVVTLRAATAVLALWASVAVAQEEPAASEGRALHPPVAWSDILEKSDHPAIITRVLVDGPPGLWDAAALKVLGEDEEVPVYAVDVILHRLDSLGDETRSRVLAALLEDARDPRVLPLLGRFAYEPRGEDDPRLREIATRHLESAEIRAAYERQRRGEDPFPRPTPEPAPLVPERSPEPEPDAVTPWLVVLLLVSGWLGLVLFLWGLRLLRLRRLVRGLPPSRARSLAAGQVALQGEAQPLEGGTLTHPETGEVCLFYEGAQDVYRFSVVDETGPVTVDPKGAVLLSADGVIVPGERVHLIAEARPDRDEMVVAASTLRQSAFQRMAQLMVGSVMGGLFGRGSARMLFSDPLRAFWVWDDLQATPFTTFRETAWLVGSFLLAGGWVVVFVAVAVRLFDR